ncbi:MAG: hypothetical protein WCI56_03185 [Hyphomicrobiales bacterium]
MAKKRKKSSKRAKPARSRKSSRRSKGGNPEDMMPALFAVVVIIALGIGAYLYQTKKAGGAELEHLGANPVVVLEKR